MSTQNGATPPVDRKHTMLYVEPELLAVIEKIKADAGLPNRGHVLRRAIALLAAWQEQRALGFKLYLRNAEGKEHEVQIP